MNITDNALQHLPDFRIRIKVKKGGCSGYELIMEAENYILKQRLSQDDWK